MKKESNNSIGAFNRDALANRAESHRADSSPWKPLTYRQDVGNRVGFLA
jgi:hypothetical protein